MPPVTLIVPDPPLPIVRWFEVCWVSVPLLRLTVPNPPARPTASQLLATNDPAPVMFSTPVPPPWPTQNSPVELFQNPVPLMFNTLVMAGLVSPT